ncbi:MAG TPA: nucleoside triphosphate pyrophosphohydrolase [Streptosporangiaceae bacterium]|jgi:predicted house-cleaning noncanonical NTP pyrophosphatase (MazG superfamily)
MRVTYRKLVRDRIPEIIRDNGGQPATRILSQEDFRAALIAKLGEEAHEVSAAPAADLPGELADVLEVLRALAGAAGLTWAELTDEAARKRAERGGFRDRIFLEHVDQDAPADH